MSASATSPDQLDLIASALADRTRRGLLRLTRERERSAGDLAASFPQITRPAVSQHLRVLARAGLVTVRQHGSRRLYRAHTEALAPVSSFVDEMWSNHLQELKRAAEEPERTMTVTTTIEHAVDIDATPDRVYGLWTTPEGLCAWWGVDATCEARPGGPIRVGVDGDHVMVGRFVELDEPHHLMFTFGWEGGDPAPGSTTVDVRIEPRGSGSRLVLRHDGLPGELVAGHAESWIHFLGERLVDALP